MTNDQKPSTDYEKLADKVGLVPNVRKKDNLYQGSAVLGTTAIGSILGAVFGGWPVPWLHVSSTHLFTTGAGIFATGRSDIAIMGNSFCGSHLSPWTIGAYLADRCRNVRITGNSFWTTRPKQGHGLVIDASQDGVISENAIDGSVRIGIWLAPKCGQGWTMTGNSNRGIDALIDQRKP